MIDIQENIAVKAGSERSFGLVFAFVFFVIGTWPVMGGENPRWWAIIVALVFLAAAKFAPSTLTRLNTLWFKFGILRGMVVGPVIMGLIFVLAVTPTALIMRLLKKDLLHLDRNADCASYWITKDENSVGTMRDQF